MTPQFAPSGQLRATFDTAVAANEHITAADGALVEAGRKIADRVDAATYEGGAEATKALYLVPHLTNILRELLATPASRVNAGVSEPPAATSALSRLRAVAGANSA